LVCAHELKKKGIVAKLFEAGDRVGGRMRSVRGKFGTQVAEFGGELIDTGHGTIMALATELGLELEDLVAFDASVRKDTYFIGGRVLTDTEVVDRFRPIAMEMATTLELAEADDAVFETTDAISIRAWLDSIAGADEEMKTLLDVAYTIEYGLEAEEQSIFNMLYLIDYETVDPFRVFGDSDEAFHLKGGSDLIPTGLASRLEGQIQTGHRLTRISAGTMGRIKLSFDRAGSAVESEFDRVVLALPFTMLREVEISLPLPPEKTDAIDNLGYGTNAKLIGGFTSRPWRTTGQTSGSATTDNGLQAVWETSRAQAGDGGILTNYLGGQPGLAIGGMTAETAFTAALPGLEQIFPGTTAAYSGNAVLAHWPTQPLAKGSYACYTPGQWAFFGTEKTAVDNLHFAGEHTSEDYQGYMEGGAESGARAAMEVATALGMSASGLLAARVGPSLRRAPRLQRAKLMASRVRARRRFGG
jgi:monoamine oxidase